MVDSGDGMLSLFEGRAFKNAYKKVPTALWLLDDEPLREKARPTRTDHALKSALWNEVRIALQENRPVISQRIYNGLCTYQHWFHNVLRRPEKLAWLLRSSPEFDLAIRALMDPVLERIREIIDLPLRDSEGRTLVGNAKLIIKAFRLIEERYPKGVIAQGRTPPLKEVEELPTLEDLEQKLKELSSQITQR